ncbi:MAG: glycosyltransferase family 2 protein [Bacteroidetes bacterium]|nr:glycosyltransferase family 2 protein [Bacteroidota bacterium]
MISIGLPAFKPQFLAVAIRSVLDQTWTGFELIIVNSGRNEAIRSVAGTFSDARIRYVEGDALPIVENWNKVLSLATGEYFILFADDDLYDPRFLEEMIRLPEAAPSCNVFHCRVREIDQEGNLIRVSAPCPVFETGPEFILNRMKGQRLQFAPDFMCRTAKLREAGGFIALPLAWGTDDLTWFTLALDGGIACCPEPLVSWRKSVYQVSAGGDVVQRLEAVTLYRDWIRRLLQEHRPASDDEAALMKELESIYPHAIDDQNNFLVEVHAGNSTLAQHMRFFLKNHGEYGLNTLWFANTLARKLINRL